MLTLSKDVTTKGAKAALLGSKHKKAAETKNSASGREEKDEGKESKKTNG